MSTIYVLHLLVLHLSHAVQSLTALARRFYSEAGPLLPLTMHDDDAKQPLSPLSPRFVLLTPSQPSPPLFNAIDPTTGATLTLDDDASRPRLGPADTLAARRSRRRAHASRSAPPLRVLITPTKSSRTALSHRAPTPQGPEDVQRQLGQPPRSGWRGDPRMERRPRALRVLSAVSERDEEEGEGGE